MHRLAFSAVLFDMDGVLINSRETITTAWSRIADEQGVALGPGYPRDHVHGHPDDYTLNYLFGHLPMERRRILKQRVDALEKGADCPLLPGVAMVIRQLRWLDVPLTLITGSRSARIGHVLRQRDLQAAFRTLVSRNDVVRGKSAPGDYRLAAARLGVTPSRCLVSEDSLSGVQATCAAGATCVAIGEESGLLAAGARWSVRDFRELWIVREDDRLYCQYRHPATTGSERSIGVP